MLFIPSMEQGEANTREQITLDNSAYRVTVIQVLFYITPKSSFITISFKGKGNIYRDMFLYVKTLYRKLLYELYRTQ